GLQLKPDGGIGWGDNNFVARTRQMFARSGLVTALLDAPSDRQEPPFLQGFRQRPDHTADLKAVIAWLRENYKVPVWLVGNSRGTESAGYVATELADGGGPDGVVLTSTERRQGTPGHGDAVGAHQGAGARRSSRGRRLSPLQVFRYADADG